MFVETYLPTLVINLMILGKREIERQQNFVKNRIWESAVMSYVENNEICLIQRELTSELNRS